MSAQSAVSVVDPENVPRAMRRLAAPTAASIVADQLLGIVDTIVIGSLGTTALAAVTAASSIFVVLVFVVHGFTSGVGILGAQAIGANDPDRFGRIVRSSALVPLGIAILCALATLRFGSQAMHLYVGSLGVGDLATPYLQLRCLSLIPIVVGGLAYAAFGAAGNTVFGVRLLVAINAVHIPLVLILALGWGTGHPLGVTGAGIASLSSEIAGAIYTLREFARARHLRIFARPEIDLRLAWRSAVLGAPEAVYLFMVLVPDIVIVGVLAPLGAAAVAAFRAIAIVSDVTFAVPGSLGSAAQTVIGQRFGAGDWRGALRFFLRARRYGIIVSSLCGLAFAILSWPFSALITFSPALASAVAAPLAIHMLTLPLKGYAMLGLAAMRAAGDTRFSMIVGVVASLAVVPAVEFAVRDLHIGLYAVPFAWIIGWTLWCGLTALRLTRYSWQRGRLAA